MTQTNGALSEMESNNAALAPASDTREANGVPIGDLLQERMQALINISPEKAAAIDAENAAREARLIEQRRQQRLSEFLASIGKTHRPCRLSNFDAVKPSQKEALSALKDYANTLPERIDNREGVVLFGPVGTGKDHLAVSLAGIAVQHHDQRAMLVNVQDWFGAIRDGMDTDQQERNLLRELTAPDILILSDPLPPFGPLGQHMATMLYRLVEQRDSLGRLTWVTVNVSTDAEADERFGAATWDRICHRAWKIHCNWPSYRKPARTVNC